MTIHTKNNHTSSPESIVMPVVRPEADKGQSRHFLVELTQREVEIVLVGQNMERAALWMRRFW